MEVNKIKPAITSRKEILRNCRKIVSTDGLAALNMRSVAKKCDVALGSLYYYFPSKEDLLVATILSVWKEIFQIEKPGDKNLSFTKYIEVCFEKLRKGSERYPNFLTMHSISFASLAKDKSRETMEIYQTQIKGKMLEALRADPLVKEDAFTNEFNESDFIDFVFGNSMSLLIDQKNDCRVLIEVISRIIY